MVESVSQRLVIIMAFLAGPVGVLAPKGMTIVVAVTGLAGLAMWAQQGRPFRHYSFALVLAALAGWAVVSAIWSIDPTRSVVLVMRLVGVAAAGGGLLYAVSVLDPAGRRAAENGFLYGMALGLALLVTGFVYAKMTGSSLWSTFFFDPLTTLNNGAIVISLLAWPALALVWRRNKTAAALVAIMAYAGFWFLSSGAALLAPVMGLLGFLVVWFTGRRGRVALGVLISVLVLMAPQMVSTGVLSDAAKAVPGKLPPSASHRLAMWTFAVEKIDEKPVLGWGMDASRSIPQSDRRMADNMEIMPLHPHNAFLQVRLELGWPGIVLVGILTGLIIAGIGGAGDRFSAALPVGAGVAYLTVASLSYGVWQNWWMGFAWVLAAFVSIALKAQSAE